MLKVHENEIILIRSPPSFLKCQSAFPIVNTSSCWSLYLLFKCLSIIFHPMYISIVCLASWMIASHYKQSEPNYKLLSPVSHLTVMKPMALILSASPCFVARACQQGCFSPLPSPGCISGICYTSLLKWCWGKISQLSAVSFQQFSLLWPLAFICEYIRLGIMQVRDGGENSG